MSCASSLDIQKLGFADRIVPSSMKGLLFTSWPRSKLLYGCENSNISENETRELQSHEAGMLKRALGLGSTSKNICLFYSLNIVPTENAIFKRKLKFVLFRNDLTRELIIQEDSLTYNAFIEALGVGLNVN